jgi:hypothetical protein
LLQQTTDAIYYYGKRIGMIMWNMYAWHGNYGAMQLTQIKRDRNPDTHIYGSSCFSNAQIKCWLAWQDKAWVHYTKLNEVGKILLAFPIYSIYCL